MANEDKSTEGLQDGGKAVEELLASSPQEDVKSGVQSQAELDVENPAAELTPAKGIESPEVPDLIQPPVGATGDEIMTPGVVAPEDIPVSNELAAQLEEIFPGSGYQSLDDLKQAGIADQLTQAGQAAIRNKELEASQNELQGKLSQKLNPYANDEIAELNSFTKEVGVYDPVLFHKLKHTDLENMDALDVLTMQMEASNRNGKLSSLDIKDYLKGEYNLDAKDFSHIDDDDERREAEINHKQTIKRSLTRLEINADKARSELGEMKAKIKPVDLAAEMAVNEKEAQDKVEQLSKEWTPHIATSIDKLRKYAIELPGENGEMTKLADFEIPEERLEFYKNEATRFAISKNIPTDEEGIKAINDFMHNIIWMDHRQKIIQKAVNADRAGLQEETDREISNPSGEHLPIAPDQTEVVQKPKTGNQLQEEAFLGAMDQLRKGEY